MAKQVQAADSIFSASKLFQHGRVRRYDWDKDGDEVLGIYPITLEIGASGPKNCPHSCNFCMHGDYYNMAANMSPDLYKKIINEVTSYESSKRPKSVIFSSSGESTVNKNIVEMLKYTKNSGLDQSLVTNGWGWVNRKKREGLVETVLDNVSWTRTSLNAGTHQTRYNIHGVGDFEQVLDGLTYLARQKKERESNCHIGAQIVVTDENFHEIVGATKLVKETGIDYFQIKPVVFHPLGGKPQLSKDFWENVMNISRVAENLYEDKGFKVFVKDDQFGAMMKSNYDQGSYDICRATFFPIIEADGTVFHCSQTRGMPEFELGNLTNQTFKDIWEGNRRKEVVKKIDPSKCQPVCRGHFNNKLLNTIVHDGNAKNFV